MSRIPNTEQSYSIVYSKKNFSMEWKNPTQVKIKWDTYALEPATTYGT